MSRYNWWVHGERQSAATVGLHVGQRQPGLDPRRQRRGAGPRQVPGRGEQLDGGRRGRAPLGLLRHRGDPEVDLRRGRRPVNNAAGKCLDVKDKNTANGAKLQLWSCTGTSNQKWTFG